MSEKNKRKIRERLDKYLKSKALTGIERAEMRVIKRSYPDVWEAAHQEL